MSLLQRYKYYNFNNLNQIIGLCHSDTIDITDENSVATNEACANKDHFVNYYKYDRLGNLKEDDSQRYYYDYRNRLVKVTALNGKEIANFTYDTLGHRLEKTTSEGTTKYVYSGMNPIIETFYDKNGTKVHTKEFIYSQNIDDVLAVYITEEKGNNSGNNNSNSGNGNGNGNNSKTTLYYYIKNHLGTPIALTDDKGKIVEEYETDEFGIVSTGKNSKLNNIFFTGKIYDKEIGLYYYNFRYYNPELGRFINRDPIGIIDDINLYVYVGNNPLKWTDPWGLEAKNMLVEKYIISIFDLAVENTKGANIIVFYEGTKTNGAFDLKNNLYLRSVASKNGGVIDFNGANVTPANLGNLLAGMNMENMYLSNSITKNIFYLYEVNAAYKEGYGKNSVGIAFFDEYADNIWYDEGISIFDKYTKTSILDEKINIITNSINKLNDEFYYRDDLETKVRRYYNITK